MSRPISSAFKRAIFDQETEVIFLILLEIDHGDLDNPIWVVNNYEDIESNGNTYVGYPFTIALPNETEDAPAVVTLTIDNVDRTIVNAVRTCTSAPSISISVILEDDPDTVEAGPFSMSLRSAEYNAMTVSGVIKADDILNEPYPGVIITPQNFPSLFI